MDVETGAMASLLPKLDELLNEKYKLQASIKEDVAFLSREMKSIHAALRKVAEVPRDQLDEQVKLWAGEDRQLSYNMEVLVDSCLMSLTSSEVSKGLIKKMGNLFKKDKTCHQIVAATIKDMKFQVQEVTDRHARYASDTIVAYALTSIDPRLMALYAKGGDLVGIDGKKDLELMKVLSDGDNASNTKLKIVSVVGFGGLGKTTLVKAVYDKIKIDFDCNAFVVAGLNADVKKVIKDILIDLSMNKQQLDTLDKQQLDTLDKQQLIETLQEILHNKRYLIVIDDVWDEELWEIISCAFSNNNNLGSRIITTTRIVSVSKACCPHANDSIYQMESLSDDNSKKLLYARIFGSVSRGPHEFEQVSIDILKKCGGVPLAIITMASVLAGDPQTKTKDEWHALLKSIGRGHEENIGWKDMRTTLSYSYYDLPPHLKTCLLYLSIFPVTHPIEKDRLAKKLIVEGIVTQETKLIASSNKKEAKLSQELSLEEAASQYLAELVNRNVIHPLECNSNSAIITYHIHPMMHDALKAIAIEEKFAASLDDKDISREHRMNFRHLSIDSPNSENLLELSSMAFDGGVHSLTVFGHANQFMLWHFKGIRILDLEGCKSIERADLEYICTMDLLKQLCLAKTDITELPPQIGNLQYLEGLDVGGTQITQLPTHIAKLQHLKTLDARKSRVKDLPDQVVGLRRLVHLLIGNDESCEGVKLPDGIGKMTSLQQLCTIDLRKCSVSSLKELGELPDLKYIAVVSSDEPEHTRMNNALLSSLKKSTKLRSLVVYSDFRLSTLQSSTLYNLNCQKKLTVVRRSLKVPMGIADYFLRMLDIRVCKLEGDDLKILRELSRLQRLVVRLEVLPTEMIRISCEGFAKLESFHVDCRMPRVIFEEGAMPKLEHLELKLYAGSATKEHMGIKHLLNLQKVTLRYSKWYATNKGVKEATGAVKIEAKEHQNEITLCIAEEHKDGTCSMKTEIFQENRVASCSRMTEIEEEEDTQEGRLHQSSRATASCSGTSEIEEVVE